MKEARFSSEIGDQGVTVMSSLKQRSRDKLVATIRQQQQEINSLRQRVELLEAADVGLLQQEVDELKSWKAHAEELIRELQVMATMTQGLVYFTATGVLALLGERVIEVFQGIPAVIDDEKQAEMSEKLGEFAADLVNTVAKIDGMSRDAWEKQRRIIEVRANTLPPLKRALFKALDQLARPSKFGTQVSMVLLQTFEFEQKLDAEQLETFEALAAVLDTVSNLWPLAAVNSLLPLLRHVGFDEAAEAAGEILDSLDETGMVPARLIHRVRPDLVAMGAVGEQTKPSTIRQYLEDGYKLDRSGFSPDFAAARGLVPGSPTHLKRASRAFSGLIDLYERTTPFSTADALDKLEEFSNLVQLADRFNRKQAVEVVPAKVRDKVWA